MACFVVPAVEAVVVKVIEKNIAKKEGNDQAVLIPAGEKLKWLSGMLAGGSALLAFEHVWHGEVTPWFPFLTAMSNTEDMMEMFKEMAAVGVTMALLVTGVWALGCVAAQKIAARGRVNEARPKASEAKA